MTNDTLGKDKVALFGWIADELRELYELKNHDYGDSFGESYAEWGLVSPCIRLSDKVNRLKSLSQKNRCVADESVDDTLMDLASYAIMTLIELRIEAAEEARRNDSESHNSDGTVSDEIATIKRWP